MTIARPSAVAKTAIRTATLMRDTPCLLIGHQPFVKREMKGNETSPAKCQAVESDRGRSDWARLASAAAQQPNEADQREQELRRGRRQPTSGQPVEEPTSPHGA